jgi:hypothetical protein
MGSPFRAAANATLTLLTGTGVFTTDSVGNEIEATTATTIKAYLSVDTQDGRELEENEGSNQIRIYMSGYTVEPKFLPDSIKHGDTIDCTITDLATGKNITGKFVFRTTIQMPWKAVPKALGNKFKGYFYAA